MLDREANSHSRTTISLFLNHALLAGDARGAAPANTRKTLRAAVRSHRPYGTSVQPADLAGLVHHAVAKSTAGDDLLTMLGPRQSAVLDAVLPRKIHEGVFRLTQNLAPEDFSQPVPGAVIG